jgi:hypothetical protein
LAKWYVSRVLERTDNFISMDSQIPFPSFVYRQFGGAKSFNGNISGWNVENAVTMEAMLRRTYRWWDSSRGFGARHKSLTAFSLLSLYYVVCAGLFVQSGLVQLGCEGSGQFVSHVS